MLNGSEVDQKLPDLSADQITWTNILPLMGVF